MRKVEIVKGIQSSVLGFGCSAILGSVDAKKSRRAIDIAVDGGINHFDLARSYGYGEAERFVGNVLKNKRDKIVYASKFGIQANWKADLMRPVKPLFRFAKDKLKLMSPPQKVKTNNFIKSSDFFLNRIHLNKMQMRLSLEKSLLALQTDYLDYLIIHEPLESIININELFEEAKNLKDEGKIRAFGLAYMRSQEFLHNGYISDFDMLQFDCSPGTLGYDKVVDQRGLKSNVIFSPITGGSNETTPAVKMKKIFDDFPNSVVLCSMFNELHIKANIELSV
jgi:aryl-alcohol dehydrogenase-like predicted oxidoreductase